jgi:Kae1-associated kinase Bud32
MKHNMAKKLLAEGAEAKIYHKDNVIIKERIKKSYRHPEIDTKIRRLRNKHEAKILAKAKEANINVPQVHNLNKKNEPQETYSLEIEYINGEKLATHLNNLELKKQLEIMKKLGEQIGKLHDKNIIHGDLTTSNTLLKDKKVYIIDFGLSYISPKIEDKAVDLHVLKQALEAKHWQKYEALYKAFITRYNPKEKPKILERLVAVERRGRYKKGS